MKRKLRTSFRLRTKFQSGEWGLRKDYVRLFTLSTNQPTKVKKSQYPAKRIITHKTNPSIPLPSIVRQACSSARTPAATAFGFHVGGPRLPGASL